MLAWQQHQQQQMAVAVCYQQQQQQQQLARYQQQALAAQSQAYAQAHAHAHAIHARPAQLHLGLPSLRQRTHQHGVQSSLSGRHSPTGPSSHTTAVGGDVGGLAAGAGAGAAAVATDSGARGVRDQPGGPDATPGQRPLEGGEIEDEMMEEALRAMAAAGGGEARILTRVRLAEVPIPRVWRRLVGEIIDIVVVNIMALLCLGGQRFDELFFADDAPLLALLWAAEVRHGAPFALAAPTAGTRPLICSGCVLV
eukprot:COSAG01_NODE_38_length_33931_cov_75.163632_5_plen_253_part_00